MHTIEILTLSTLFATAGCSVAASNAAPAVDVAAPSRSVRHVHVETHPSQGKQRVIEGAAASLALTDAGAVASLETNGLTPGHVYTLWFVAINAPERCASSPCKAPDVLVNTNAVRADVRWADGAIANEQGTITLTGWVPAGDWSNSWFGNGYTNADGAEVHLVLNDHGPVLAGRESAMLTSYREGCTDDSLPAPFPNTAKGDGSAGPNRCALVQDAIFTPAR
jgi:hypothetical protein